MRYYATLGPACCEASVLSALLRRGVSGFRLNVSHTMLAARRDWIDALHDAERSTGLAAQLMIDLRGPEVRIGALSSPLTLTAGEAVTLGADIPVEKDVLAALVPGMTVLLDDGAMALTVLDGGRCRVTRGGVLTGHKSLTPEGAELQFVPFARRRYRIMEVDVTDGDPAALVSAALPAGAEEDIYRVVLTGSPAAPVSPERVQSALSGRCCALQVRDKTTARQELWDKCGEDTLRGLFLQQLRSTCGADPQSQRLMEQAAAFGLAAIDDREV